MPFEPRIYKDKPDRSTPVRAEDAAHWQSQYQHAVDDLTPLFDGAVLATAGHKYRVIAFAIRNSGSGWDFIDDAGHEPIGVSGISIVGDYIKVNFDFTASRVGTLVVGADETFAVDGYTAGASVALDSASIQVGKIGANYDYVSWDGSAWVSTTGFVTSTTMNGTTGAIEFTHAEVSDALAGAVELRTSGVNRSSSGSRSATAIQATVFPYNSSTSLKAPSTDMRFFVSRAGVRKVTPASVVSASGNFWAYGIFEVD